MQIGIDRSAHRKMNTTFIFLIISTIICCVYSGYDDGPVATTNDDNDEMWSTFDNEFDKGDEPLEIAALVAETGSASFLGKVVKAGFEKAVKDRKELCSGKNKCRIPKVQYSDTKSSSSKALQLFQQHYSRGVRIFIGLVTSNEAKAVATYASKHARDAIILSPTSTATELCGYDNLRRMTMDDRGYAEVLYDLSAQHFKKQGSTLHIQVIHSNDVHGEDLYKYITKRFGQASSEGYKVLSSISYNGGNSFSSTNLRQVIRSLHNSQVTKEKHSIVVLIGLSETQLILQEAAKDSSLKNLIWILSDALTLSNIQIPQDMNVFGLGFVGDEGSSKLLNKERRGLNQYLENNKLPPMTQAQLAYDTITYILHNECNSLSQLVSSNTIVIEGLTGPLEFSDCGERTTGSYVFAASPKQLEIDNVLRKVVFNKWMVISHFIVESDERSLSQMFQDDYTSPESMVEVKLQSTSKKGVSSLASPSVEVKKEEFLKQLVEIGDKNCNKNAHITIQSHDELSQKPISVKYAVTDMPESMVFPVRYGFIMTATCHTGKKQSFSLTRVCPPTKVGGSEVICQTRVSSTAVGKVIAEGGWCTGTTVATGVCIAGVGGCFIAVLASAGIAAPVCGLIGAGCAGLGLTSSVVCRNGKYVCTELFRQGHLSPHIMLADMSFANHYSNDNPITRKGYDILGPKIASWMSSSETVTDIVKSIAIPWAEEMAYNEGYRENGNDFGALVMSIGSIVCGLIGAVYIYFNYITSGTILIAIILFVARKLRIKPSAPLAKKIN